MARTMRCYLRAPRLRPESIRRGRNVLDLRPAVRLRRGTDRIAAQAS